MSLLCKNKLFESQIGIVGPRKKEEFLTRQSKVVIVTAGCGKLDAGRGRKEIKRGWRPFKDCELCHCSA